MYDRRVVRGNTYAQHILPTVSISTDRLDNSLVSRCVYLFSLSAKSTLILQTVHSTVFAHMTLC